MQDDTRTRQSFLLTHVCVYWRFRALKDPSLWTTLDFKHPELTLLMLERAQNVPLTVQVQSVHSYAQWKRAKEVLASVLGDKLDKIKDLRLSAGYSSRPDLEALLSGIPGPLPMVESLEIHRNDPWGAVLNPNTYVRASFL